MNDLEDNPPNSNADNNNHGNISGAIRISATYVEPVYPGRIHMDITTNRAAHVSTNYLKVLIWMHSWKMM